MDGKLYKRNRKNTRQKYVEFVKGLYATFALMYVVSPPSVSVIESLRDVLRHSSRDQGSSWSEVKLYWQFGGMGMAVVGGYLHCIAKAWQAGGSRTTGKNFRNELVKCVSEIIVCEYKPSIGKGLSDRQTKRRIFVQLLRRHVVKVLPNTRWLRDYSSAWEEEACECDEPGVKEGTGNCS